MTYDKHTPILGAGTGDPDAIALWASERGASRSNDLRHYLRTIYAEVGATGINPDVLVAQSHLETGGWTSYWWEQRLNPAGIGITGDDAQNAASRAFNSMTAACAHVVHMYLYAVGTNLPHHLYPTMDPRWDNAVEAGYAGVARTLDDLNGRWAIDPQNAYGEKIADRLNQLAAAGLIDHTQGTGEPQVPFTKPYIIIDAGHRSTGDPGNPDERALTDDVSKAAVDVFRAAGYRADWVQRDLDKDGLADITKGDLNTVGRVIAQTIAAAPEQLVLVYSFHMDGYTSVIHAIPPDNVGLRTAIPNGAPAVDTAANNTLDVNLAAEITAELAKVTGLPIYPVRRLGIKGVMSERDTNVGSQGFRLGFHAYTAPYRLKAVRLVIELAGINQITKVADWANVSAKATIRATERVLEARGGPVGGDDGGAVEPPVDAVPPKEIPELSPYLKAGTLISVPPAVVVGTGGTYIFADHRVKVIRPTKRRQESRLDSPVTGIDLVEGESFPVAFIHQDANAAWWWITPWNSHVLVTDTEILEREV